MKTSNTRPQFRAQFALPNCMGSLTADSQETIVEKLNSLANNLAPGGRGVEVDKDSSKGTSYLYHHGISDGKQPFGLINEIAVPDNLSVDSTIAAWTGQRSRN